MNFATLTVLAFALGADSFSVCITNGICYGKRHMRRLAVSVAIFSITQGVMPLLGFAAGQIFTGYMQSIDHWAALILLSAVGIKMVWEAWHEGDESCPAPFPDYRLLFMQAVATSIDAFTVGMSFAVMRVDILSATLIIVAVTAVCCAVGIAFGVKFGQILGNKAAIFGGIMLVLIGIKIFLEG